MLCLLGKNIWSNFDEWYFGNPFRGHVREPVIADLYKILKIMDFEAAGIFGRNWLGMYNQKTRAIVSVFDLLLQLRPSLCSNLYIIGRKPQ